MKILIATDGSDYSKAAIDECCRMVAYRDDIEIKIVSAYENVYVLMGEPVAFSAEYYQELSKAAADQAGLYAADAAKTVESKVGDKVKSLSVDVINGPPEQKIVEVAKDWGADLVVVGSHGRGFWGRLLGSVSDAVVHHAPCSVMVVRR